jgi:AcrR family transcriptional regulator
MLTEQKEKAITGLLKGEQRVDICRKAGISRPTLYTWMKDEEFSKEYEVRKKEIVKSGNDFVLAMTQTYLDKLNGLATTSTDARTQASVLMYLVDRSLGKIAQRYEVEPVEMAKVPSREELEAEFENFRKEVPKDE